MPAIPREAGPTERGKLATGRDVLILEAEEVLLMSEDSHGGSGSPSSKPGRFDPWPVVHTALLLGGYILAGVFIGGLLKDVQTVKDQLRDMNNPVDATSLKYTVIQADHRALLFARTFCRMAEELHPGNLSTVRKYCDDYEKAVTALRPLNSPIKVPAFVEPSEVVKGMWRFRRPGASRGEHSPVEPFLPGRIDSVTHGHDGAATVVMSHGGGFGSEYVNLKFSSVKFRVGDLVSPGQSLGETVAASPMCLRVGLIGPDGKFIDPTPFFEHPPKPQLEGSKGESHKP